MADPVREQQLPFSIETFSEWYDQYRAKFLEPARDNAVKALNELFDDALSERDRIRVDVRPGRVKSKVRAWQKLNNKYADKVSAPADVPNVMDDLVGLRVVCTNTSDLRGVIDILAGLETWTDGNTPVLAVHTADSARDYLGEGKSSGYRAYHLNLCTSVALATERHVVVCELQLRTLLQDSWGELTHEDTYKPGNEPPPLVSTLSKRMADLMATLDDMAQDLRDELEQITAGVTERDGSSEGTPKAAAGFSASDREAAYQYLADRTSTLTRPVDWASLAWEMQREFGQDIINGWVGHESFKDLLLAVVDQDQVITQPPGYVLPRNFDRANFTFGSSDKVPRLATLLHEADKRFPLTDTTRWQEAYRALSAATASNEGSGPPTITLLTKRAREISQESDILVTRRQLDHIARALRSANELRPNMSQGDVGDAFREWTRAQAASFGTSPSELGELDSWLGG
jgi:ppGpp synthetase/RelA/SpoT-type nucleotidyltranferase